MSAFEVDVDALSAQGVKIGGGGRRSRISQYDMAAWKAQYEGSDDNPPQSIRAIAEKAGSSYGTVRRSLVMAGVKLRGRGGDNRRTCPDGRSTANGNVG